MSSLYPENKSYGTTGPTKPLSISEFQSLIKKNKEAADALKASGQVAPGAVTHSAYAPKTYTRPTPIVPNFPQNQIIVPETSDRSFPVDTYPTSTPLANPYSPQTTIKNLVGKGQYLDDPTNPNKIGWFATKERESNATEEAMIRAGYNPAYHQIDHAMPIALDGVDTVGNKVILSQPEHNAKSKIQQVAIRMFQENKLSKTQAQSFAANWEAYKPWIDQIPSGYKDGKWVDITAEQAEKAYKAMQKAPTFSWKKFKEAVPEAPKQIKNPFIREAFKGAVSQIPLLDFAIPEVRTWAANDEYATPEEKNAASVGKVLGSIFGGIVAFGAVGKVLGLAGRGIGMAGRGLGLIDEAKATAKLLEAMKVGKSVSSVTEGAAIKSLKEAYELKALLGKGFPVAKMTSKELMEEMIKMGGVNTVLGQTYSQEDNSLGSRAVKAALDFTAGTFIGGDPARVGSYVRTMGGTATIALMMGENIQSALTSGATMTALHGASGASPFISKVFKGAKGEESLMAVTHAGLAKQIAEATGHIEPSKMTLKEKYNPKNLTRKGKIDLQEKLSQKNIEENIEKKQIGDAKQIRGELHGKGYQPKVSGSNPELLDRENVVLFQKLAEKAINEKWGLAKVKLEMKRVQLSGRVLYKQGLSPEARLRADIEDMWSIRKGIKAGTITQDDRPQNIIRAEAVVNQTPELIRTEKIKVEDAKADSVSDRKYVLGGMTNKDNVKVINNIFDDGKKNVGDPSILILNKEEVASSGLFSKFSENSEVAIVDGIIITENGMHLKSLQYKDAFIAKKKADGVKLTAHEAAYISPSNPEIAQGVYRLKTVVDTNGRKHYTYQRVASVASKENYRHQKGDDVVVDQNGNTVPEWNIDHNKDSLNEIITTDKLQGMPTTLAFIRGTQSGHPFGYALVRDQHLSAAKSFSKKISEFFTNIDSAAVNSAINKRSLSPQEEIDNTILGDEMSLIRNKGIDHENFIPEVIDENLPKSPKSVDDPYSTPPEVIEENMGKNPYPTPPEVIEENMGKRNTPPPPDFLAPSEKKNIAEVKQGESAPVKKDPILDQQNLSPEVINEKTNVKRVSSSEELNTVEQPKAPKTEAPEVPVLSNEEKILQQKAVETSGGALKEKPLSSKMDWSKFTDSRILTGPVEFMKELRPDDKKILKESIELFNKKSIRDIANEYKGKSSSPFEDANDFAEGVKARMSDIAGETVELPKSAENDLKRLFKRETSKFQRGKINYVYDENEENGRLEFSPEKATAENKGRADTLAEEWSSKRGFETDSVILSNINTDIDFTAMERKLSPADNLFNSIDNYNKSQNNDRLIAISTAGKEVQDTILLRITVPAARKMVEEYNLKPTAYTGNNEILKNDVDKVLHIYFNDVLKVPTYIDPLLSDIKSINSNSSVKRGPLLFSKFEKLSGPFDDKEIDIHTLQQKTVGETGGLDYGKLEDVTDPINAEVIKSILKRSQTDGFMLFGPKLSEYVYRNTFSKKIKKGVKPIIFGTPQGGGIKVEKGRGITIDKGWENVLKTQYGIEKVDPWAIYSFGDNVKLGSTAPGVTRMKISDIHIKNSGYKKGLKLSHAFRSQFTASDDVNKFFSQIDAKNKEQFTEIRNELKNAVDAGTPIMPIIEKHADTYGWNLEDIFFGVRGDLAKKGASGKILGKDLEKIIKNILNVHVASPTLQGGGRASLIPSIQANWSGDGVRYLRNGEKVIGRKQADALGIKKSGVYKMLTGRDPITDPGNLSVDIVYIAEDYGITSMGDEHIMSSSHDTYLAKQGDYDGDSLFFYKIGEDGLDEGIAKAIIKKNKYDILLPEAEKGEQTPLSAENIRSVLRDTYDGGVVTGTSSNMARNFTQLKDMDASFVLKGQKIGFFSGDTLIGTIPLNPKRLIGPDYPISIKLTDQKSGRKIIRHVQQLAVDSAGSPSLAKLTEGDPDYLLKQILQIKNDGEYPIKKTLTAVKKVLDIFNEPFRNIGDRAADSKSISQYTKNFKRYNDISRKLLENGKKLSPVQEQFLFLETQEGLGIDINMRSNIEDDLAGARILVKNNSALSKRLFKKQYSVAVKKIIADVQKMRSYSLPTNNFLQALPTEKKERLLKMGWVEKGSDNEGGNPFYSFTSKGKDEVKILKKQKRKELFERLDNVLDEGSLTEDDMDILAYWTGTSLDANLSEHPSWLAESNPQYQHIPRFVDKPYQLLVANDKMSRDYVREHEKKKQSDFLKEDPQQNTTDIPVPVGGTKKSEAPEDFSMVPEVIKEDVPKKPANINEAIKNRPKIVIGSDVKYGGKVYQVVGENKNGTFKIMNPSESNVKLSVKESNLSLVKNPAGSSKVVTYQGKQYIVTPNRTIISLTSGRPVHVAETNGIRKKIMEAIKSRPTLKKNS